MKTTTTIKAYSKIEAGIAALREKYSTVPECDTASGLELCKKSYREIRKVETALEKERKTQGDAARVHLALISSEAKAIDEQLKQVSAPFKVAFEARELEIKAVEEKRIAEIKTRIGQLSGFVMDATNQDSEGVAATIEAVDMIDCAEHFDEFTAEALQTKNDTLRRLGEMLQQKIQAENAEAARQAAEQARQEAEQAAEAARHEAEAKAAVEKRLNTLRMMPMDYMRKSASEISAKIDSLKGYVIPEEEFVDRYQEAVNAQALVIQQLGMSLQMAVQLEEAAAIKQDQERRDREASESVVFSEEVAAGNVEKITVEGVDFPEGPYEVVTAEVSEPKSNEDRMRLDIDVWCSSNNVAPDAVEELMMILDLYCIF